MANAGQAVIQAGPLWASRDEFTLRIGSLVTSAMLDFARTAAYITTVLYKLVEREGTSTENVSFRVRSSMRPTPGQREHMGGGCRHRRPERAAPPRHSRRGRHGNVPVGGARSK